MVMGSNSYLQSCLPQWIIIILIIECTKIECITPRQSNSSSNNRSVKTLKYKLPEGCYGPKQLRDMLTLNTSIIKYKPEAPKWCSTREPLIPEYLAKPNTSSPPFRIRVYPFKKSDVFRVVVQSTTPNVTIADVIIVARDVDLNGTIQTNSGRFLPTEEVELICCSYTDKDVARYKTNKDGIKQAVFYWVPYEEVMDDYEGDIIFTATVATNTLDYWTNITSEIIDFTPPTFAELMEAIIQKNRKSEKKASSGSKSTGLWNLLKTSIKHR